MSQFTCERKLDFLNPNQKGKLNRRFRSSHERIMPHELAVFLGVKRSQADAILIALDSAGLCNMRLLIFHTCSEAHIGSIDFGVGFPSLPWKCSECDQIIEDYAEMSFDLMALVPEPVEFI